MSNRLLHNLRVLAGTSLMTLVATSVAFAQVAPNPPTGFSIEGGTSLPPGGGAPAGLLFFDDFNYVVNKLDSAAAKTAAFTAAGWSGVKDAQTRDGASGYLSTVASIPGYSGLMPGLSGSGRALRMEGLPTTLGSFSGPSGTWQNQTDFYLALGTPGPTGRTNPAPVVPGNVWYQFWIYVNDSGSERSHWSNRNKLIYPSDDGTASGSGTENSYLISVRPSSQEGVTQPYGPNAYVTNKIEGSTIVSPASDGASYIGVNEQPTTGYTPANQWVLYKIHVDHASPNGTYEVWKRPLRGTWVKTTEWISGVTNGFTWITHANQRAGHNVIKVPTTWGTAQQDDNTSYDAWVYMADFAIASREADLPVYAGY